jgi:hypothetical protein
MNRQIKSALFDAMGKQLHRKAVEINTQVKTDLDQMDEDKWGVNVAVPLLAVKTALAQSVQHRESVATCVTMLEMAAKGDDEVETEASQMYKMLSEIANTKTLLEKLAEVMIEGST